jgi:hypothetical protein
VIDSNALVLHRESEAKRDSPFFHSERPESNNMIVGSSPGSETPDIHQQPRDSESDKEETELRRLGTNYKSSMKWKQQVITRKRKTMNQLIIEGKSLYLFSETNWLRLKVCSFCENPYFEYVILYLIALNSIIMAMDSPTLED